MRAIYPPNSQDHSHISGEHLDFKYLKLEMMYLTIEQHLIHTFSR